MFLNHVFWTSEEVQPYKSFPIQTKECRYCMVNQTAWFYNHTLESLDVFICASLVANLLPDTAGPNLSRLQMLIFQIHTLPTYTQLDPA